MASTEVAMSASACCIAWNLKTGLPNCRRAFANSVHSFRMVSAPPMKLAATQIRSYSAVPKSWSRLGQGKGEQQVPLQQLGEELFFLGPGAAVQDHGPGEDDVHQVQVHRGIAGSGKLLRNEHDIQEVPVHPAVCRWKRDP
jgi:hypothetical protein